MKKNPRLLWTAQGQVFVAIPFWWIRFWYFVGVLTLAAVVGVMVGAAIWDLTHWQ